MPLAEMKILEARTKKGDRMTKTEIKRLARHMASYYLRELVDSDDAIETGLEIRNVCLEDDEKQQLIEAIQEIIDKLRKL
jgi:hypothetical protein